MVFDNVTHPVLVPCFVGRRLPPQTNLADAPHPPGDTVGRVFRRRLHSARVRLFRTTRKLEWWRVRQRNRSDKHSLAAFGHILLRATVFEACRLAAGLAAILAVFVILVGRIDQRELTPEHG